MVWGGCGSARGWVDWVVGGCGLGWACVIRCFLMICMQFYGTTQDMLLKVVLQLIHKFLGKNASLRVPALKPEMLELKFPNEGSQMNSPNGAAKAPKHNSSNNRKSSNEVPEGTSPVSRVPAEAPNRKIQNES